MGGVICVFDWKATGIMAVREGRGRVINEFNDINDGSCEMEFAFSLFFFSFSSLAEISLCRSVSNFSLRRELYQNTITFELPHLPNGTTNTVSTLELYSCPKNQGKSAYVYSRTSIYRNQIVQSLAITELPVDV